MGVHRSHRGFCSLISVTHKHNTMKNLILIIATVLSFTTASFASNIGDGTLAIVKTAAVEMTLENEGQKEFILSSVFEAENDNIAMVFDADVSMIQVFNTDGELEMMFPVGSTEVNLGMSLFTEGSYKMGFTVDGISDVQYTNLKVK